ncbi:MAG: hypothetical protein O2821_09910 [Chloroflexi bacterium]|nr:hypothetical protein [Chloroflexota bacterium]MDA1226451.1 hypothetical protein [Chloroflexota bacterium]
MSKFVEMLEKTRDMTPEPMGFGAARHSKRNPSIVLIGQASADDLEKNAKLADAQADAILLTVATSNEKALENASTVLKDKLWGVRVGSVTEQQAASLKEKGCDFIVFDPENTEAAVLNDEVLGKIIAVNSEIDEDTGQALHLLSIDCAMFTSDESLTPLTVQRLLDIEIVRGIVGKMFIMSAPADLGKSELEALRNGGVAGLVVNLSAAEDIANTKKTIDSLPRRPDRGRGGLMAQAPTAGFGAFASANAPDEEEDDEDDEE